MSCVYRAMSRCRGVGAKVSSVTSRGGRLRRVLTDQTHVYQSVEWSGENLQVPASVRPHMGPASTRVKSSTRIPSSACWISPGSVRTRFGASSILAMYIGLMFVWNMPCGVASISSYERSAAAQRCRRNTSASNSTADHLASAAATASFVGSHCRISRRPCL